MSTYTEQEELDRLKAWWKNYGGALIAGVVIGITILVGQKYWSAYQERTRLEAATHYDEMLHQIGAGNLDSARARGAVLAGEYKHTPYAGLAALLTAKLDVEKGDSAAAREHLEWAVTHATDPAVVHSARLRLGRVLLQSGDPTRATEVAAIERMGGFESEYQELSGDIYMAQSRTADARAAYRAAIEATPTAAPYRRILEMKLENLGPEQKS